MSENTTAAQTPSIADTLLAALTESGISAHTAGPALKKAEELLQEREYTIAETIINEADVQYGYGSQATELLESAGLKTRPVPVAEEAADVPAGDEDRLGKLEAAVNKLVEVAERHLGVKL